MNQVAPVLFGVIAVSAATVLAVPACTTNVMVDGRPCPCAEGWTCCETQNMCVSSGSACPGSTVDSGGAVSDAGDGGGTISDAGDGIVLASNLSMPAKIVLDDENVYFLSFTGAFKMAKTGGAPTALTDAPLQNVKSLAIDSTSLYFPRYKSIVAVPLAGGPTRTVVAATTEVLGVAIANGELYWAGSDRETPDGGADGGSTLIHEAEAFKVATAGGTPTEISLPIVDTGEGVFPSGYWVGCDTVASSDAVYAYMGFLGSGSTGGLLKLPVDGAAATFVPGGQFGGLLAVDESNVFFSTSTIESAWAWTIQRMPKTGGTPTRLADRQPTAMVVDGAFVYFAEEGKISKVPKEGGLVVDLANRECFTQSIAVDAISVYWTCFNDGTLKKIAK